MEPFAFSILQKGEKSRRVGPLFRALITCNVVHVVSVGAGESGKSTIVKQMK